MDQEPVPPPAAADSAAAAEATSAGGAPAEPLPKADAEPTPDLQPPPTREGEPQDAPVAAAPPAEPLPPELTEPIDVGPFAPTVERMRRPEGSSTSDPILNPHPSGLFLLIVTLVSFVSDVATKVWAEHNLSSGKTVVVFGDHLQFGLARNRGGAWGILQQYDENVRRPFFLLVSVAAIVFIIALYRRLQPRQRALKWGLPLVLGGALGNVFDRIRYGSVIDFIDYRADWIKKSYDLLDRLLHDQMHTDHWPTFNVADVCICVGVGLMAIDMFTAKKKPMINYVVPATEPPPPPPPPPAEPPAAEPPAETVETA
jgi:signal peptidase II